MTSTGSAVVIEDVGDDTWGVGIGSFNPEQKHYFKVQSEERAFALKSVLDSKDARIRELEAGLEEIHEAAEHIYERPREAANRIAELLNAALHPKEAAR